MVLKQACIILSNCIPIVFLLSYEKPVAEKLWRQRCVRNSVVLNDCNWCWCSQNFRYTCNARVCGDVDMFGHFNDAIRDIDVGMEGHGVWRTTASACEPGVHYTRRDLLCVCTEEGTWPNPVCRDIFRVLHSVEVVQNFELSEYQKCTPTKLYLADCNVCFCPSTGRIDPSLCTQKKCTSELISPLTRSDHSEAGEVYAECNVDQNYKLGCKNCICLRNNRLVCDNCTESKCAGRQPGENFIVDCNTCYCDARGTVYCTFNRCLNSREEIEILKHHKVKTPIARRPLEELDCEPGTRFMKDCNTCYCFLMKGKIKKYGCTMKKCHTGDPTKQCVIGDTFSKECQLCHCNVFNDLVMEICQTDPNCLKSEHRYTLRMAEYITQECEPNHVYSNDCNTCECSPDGKKIKCTDNSCEKKPISLSIIPVVQKLPECPKGRSYKIDCNFCFCLANGNAMCTTKDCKRLNK